MFTLDRYKDTICAVSTPPGVGAIAIVRVSGSRAVEAALNLCPQLTGGMESHRVYYSHLVDTATGSQVDEVLVSYFKKGRSFTGEDVVEICCHGSPAITQQILHCLLNMGLRLAHPGEFTYRAFNSGRIDLVQAESILKLIESKSAQAAKVALRQLSGELSREFSFIEDELTWVMSRLEANIDYSAEDIEIASADELLSKLKVTTKRLDELLSSYQKGRVVQEGLRCAIVGEPNVGKSSLLNALTQTPRAIVSAQAGTTRDRIDAEIQIQGQRVLFMDTAGWRETENEVEKQGVAVAKETAKEADVLLFLYDLSNLSTRNLLSQFANADQPVVVVGNKKDLLSCPMDSGDDILISAANQDGIDKIKMRIYDLFKDSFDEYGAGVISSRQHETLKRIVGRVAAATRLLEDNVSPEIILFELNEALLGCYEILGKKYDDQVIDRVFKDFCLGK